MKSFYPNNSVNISQGYNKGNHKPHWNNANYKDYPIDETYGKTNGKFLAPFDCKVVKKYLRNGTSNGLWLTSTEKVETPVGKDYVTIMIAHIKPSELNAIKVGKTYKQFEPIVTESTEGRATGPHHHFCAGLGKMKGDGWIKNSNGCWVLTTKNGTRKPEELFYINENIKVKSSQGIKFENAKEEIVEVRPAKPTEWKKGYYTLLYAKYLRKKCDLGNNIVKVKECTDAMKKALTSTKANDKAKIKAGTTITILEIYVDKTSRVWGKNYSGWVVLCNQDGTAQSIKA